MSLHDVQQPTSLEELDRRHQAAAENLDRLLQQYEAAQDTYNAARRALLAAKRERTLIRDERMRIHAVTLLNQVSQLDLD
jgi:hypothetical protein